MDRLGRDRRRRRPLVGGLIVDQTSWRWIFAINVPLVLVTLVLVRAAVPDAPTVPRRVDVIGACLCALGLAGVAFGLIEQPRFGWGSPAVVLSLLVGVAAFGGFVVYERRASHPMLRLDLFERRNFAIANLQTLTIYAGLAVLFFFLFIFLQQVAGYSALRAGLTTIPTTVTMFVLSRRFGALADVTARALSLQAAAGRDGHPAVPQSRDRHVVPARPLTALVLFSVGLAGTVAPLTATVLVDADEAMPALPRQQRDRASRFDGILQSSAGRLTLPGTRSRRTPSPSMRFTKRSSSAPCSSHPAGSSLASGSRIRVGASGRRSPAGQFVGSRGRPAMSLPAPPR
jgi:hypothetical protein